ncbi:MAG: protein kinase [Planctomycetes bacterium]|nr:protein kinase [Planctomycetota bacterium]
MAPPNDQTVISQRPPALPGANRSLPPQELGKLLVGQTLSHFELLDFVGGGGMGAVFRARDTMLNRIVALKVLSRDQGSEDDTRRRFQNEAQSAARLDHENIARVYFVGEDRGLNYIVFEYIEGANLRDLVERHGGPLPLADAINYTLQVARALEHACSRDVVHRDIKPSNVLVTADGRAKLVDMGLARLHQVDARDDLTASGVTLGTFDYISPEQARDPRSADVRSDIYSLGCTLYYMLTARPPFPDGTVLQKLLQHTSDEPPDPRQFNHEVTDDVAAVVRKMLAKNPRRRYQSPPALIADLSVLAEALGLPLGNWSNLSNVPSAAAPTWFERHLPWAVPVMLLLAAAVAIEVVFSTPVDESQLPTINAGQMRPANGAAPDKAAPAGAEAPHAAPDAQAGATTPETNSALVANAAGAARPGDMPPVPDSAPSATITPGATATQPGAETEPPAIDPPPRPGLLVVSPTARGPQYFNSLRAACSAARNGDVVELRYNGRREERPLLLHNRRFTIRAGESYKPIVVFRPDDSNPMRYPRDMIEVTGGKLSLVNLAIELNVPAPGEIAADRWSLLALQQGDSLEVQNCSFTIRNGDQAALHSDVSLINVRALSNWNGLRVGEAADADEPAHLHWEHCVARGQATLLRIDDAQAVTFAWENGLLCTSEWLTSIHGASMAGQGDPHVRISLRHVTAYAASGFFQMLNDLDHPYLPALDIQANDNILAGDSSSLLIDQAGVDDRNTFLEYVSWNGERNFYTGFDPQSVWRLHDQNRDDGLRRLSAIDWEAHWGRSREVLPNWNGVVWRRPNPQGPLFARGLDDYALEESPDNMARAGASDGRDVGMVGYLLPPLPAEPAATPP